MTLHAVTIPKWGLAMDEGTLAKWLAPDGANVSVGEEIADIETSKIANAIEAPAAGVLHHAAAAGDAQAVGALIGVIADAGEDEATIAAYIAVRTGPGSAVEDAEGPAPVTVEVEGEPFRYLRLAPPDGAPAARPLVLIHGFGGDYANWMFNQAELAVDRPVYAIDLPGHGGSTKQVGDGSLAFLAGRVAAWMEKMGRGRVHLAGHSLGAAVAATLALDRPELVKSVTAIAGVGFGGVLARDYVEAFLAGGRRKQLQPVVERLFATPALVTREMLDDLIAARRIDGAAVALRAIADNSLGLDALRQVAERIGGLSVPVLRIAGDQDGVLIAPVSEGALLAHAGHMPHLEAAAAVNRALSEFLLKHD